MMPLSAHFATSRRLKLSDGCGQFGTGLRFLASGLSLRHGSVSGLRLVGFPWVACFILITRFSAPRWKTRLPMTLKSSKLFNCMLESVAMQVHNPDASARIDACNAARLTGRPASAENSRITNAMARGQGKRPMTRISIGLFVLPWLDCLRIIGHSIAFAYHLGV